MKIELNAETLCYSLSSIDRNELELIKRSLLAVHKLLSYTELDSSIDNQEKNIRIKRIEEILTEMDTLNGSQTAESWDGTIIRKILKKYIKC